MRILLAEDDMFFQNFYSSKLIEKGYTVDVAKNGEEAIDHITKTKPDVMLLDLIMPKKDGFEVLNEVSKREELQGFPIIVFSTLGQDDDIARAKSLGAVEYVNKTFFDFENLHSKIVTIANQ